MLVLLIGLVFVVYSKGKASTDTPGEDLDPAGSDTNPTGGTTSGNSTMKTPTSSAPVASPIIGKRAYTTKLPALYEVGTISNGQVLRGVRQINPKDYNPDSTTTGGVLGFGGTTEYFLGPIRAQSGSFVQVYFSNASQNILVQRSDIIVKDR